MIALPAAFLRYVDRAREGRNAPWRSAVSLVLIVLLWVVSTVVALVIGAFASGNMLKILANGGEGDPWPFILGFLASPYGVAATLGSFVGLSGGVFLAVKLVHRRPAGSVLGAEGRLAWGDFLKGLAAALITSGASEVATFFVDPSLRRSSLGFGAWLLWSVPLTLLLVIQVSAEEIAFRGYLMQSLAARFRSPLVWAVVPVLLFTALHWDSQSAPTMKAAILVSIGAFAISATVLVLVTGNLAAGIGAHLGLNAFGILFVSHMSWLSGGALFESRPLDFYGWTGADAFWVGAFGVASFALMLLMLLLPRSPLRVGRS